MSIKNTMFFDPSIWLADRLPQAPAVSVPPTLEGRVMHSGHFTMIHEDLQDEPIEISWQTPTDSPVWDAYCQTVLEHAQEQVRLHQEESDLDAPTLLLATLAQSAVHTYVSIGVAGAESVGSGNYFRLLCQLMSQQTGADHILVFLDQNRMVTNIRVRKYAPLAKLGEAA